MKKIKEKISNINFIKLIRLLPKYQIKRLFLVVIVLFLSALANVGGIASIMPFMRVLADPHVILENEYLVYFFELAGKPELSTFLILIGVSVLVAFIISNLFMALSVYIQHMYAQSVAFWLTSRLKRGYLEQPYEFYLNRNAADLTKNIFSEVGEVTNNIITPTIEATSKSILSVIIILFLFFVDPTVAFIAISVLGGSYLLIFTVVKKRLTRIGRDKVAANQSRFRIAAETFGGIKQLKLSSREWDYMQRFNPKAKAFEVAKAKIHIISKIPKFALELIAIGGVLSIALVLFAVEGDVAGVLPILSLYALAGYRLMPSLQTIFQSITKIKSAGASVELLYEDMKHLKQNSEKELFKMRQSRLKRLSFEKEIKLNKISYMYPNTNVEVIKGIDLRILKNTTVGFVGPTGCGKTTLIDIMLGLLKPQKGKYYVDGVEIGDNNIASWQGSIGYVPQDIFLSDDTVLNNVALGIPDSDIDRSAVYKACEIANIDDFIRTELPQGYNTVAGERGIRLSGGQRQRIGIARALYHDPQVLILDEATSALDGKTESAIMEAITKLSHRKTIIMIAHRLTTLLNCDVIWVLEEGTIIDEGSFAELKDRNIQFRMG